MSSSSGSLLRYIGVRLMLVIPMMWVLLTLVFILLRVAPGDPVTAAVGDKLDEDELDARRAKLGLDRPLIVQYFSYLWDVVRFDFGSTISDNIPVVDIIADRGGATLTLALGAFAIALLIGVPLGRVAARRRDTALDAGIRVTSIVTYAAPVFWTGLMVVLLVLAIAPNWPTFGIADAETQFYVKKITGIILIDAILQNDFISVVDIIQHHLLPWLVLGLMLSGVIIRLVRVNVIQTMKGDYVEAARARGVPEGRVMRKHAFRNALVPVVTVIGLQFALTLSGAILTEKTFAWPGLGTALVEYVTSRDYVAVQGLVTFFALAVVIVSVTVDVVNALIDPRVRY